MVSDWKQPMFTFLFNGGPLVWNNWYGAKIGIKRVPIRAFVSNVSIKY